MTPLRPVLALLVSVLGLTLCARVEVPMLPVPMTLQTWAVLVIGGLLGARWGAAAVLLYLLAAGFGLPVLAGGRAGVEQLTGPTAGYMAGFVGAAWLVGRAVHGGDGRGGDCGWRTMLAAMLAAHGVILLVGVAWLAGFVGIDKAVVGGLLPFGVGAVVKSLLAAATVGAVRRVWRDHKAVKAGD